MVLIVDDDEGVRDTLESILQDQYDVMKAGDGETALVMVVEHEIDVMLLDYTLPGINGLDVLAQIKERYEDVEVLMVTASKDIETAVKAMQLGAFHYLVKDFDYDEVRSLVEKMVSKQRGEKEVRYLRQEVEQLSDAPFVVGKNQRMRAIYDMIGKVAKLPATVLIQGESGTGKELLARYIHKESGDTSRPFVTLDLSTVPETLIESTLFGHERGAFTGAHQRHIGKFELANGGTLFLDEIGSLRFELQGKLLRAIQEGEIERVGGTKTIHVAVRLLAATNVKLKEAVKQGLFREDLYYRINVLPITLPPLRERSEDIEELVRLFMARYVHRFHKRIHKITGSALDILKAYRWPGNIRELENLIERIVAMTDGEMIGQEDIPIEFSLVDTDRHETKESCLVEACETFEQNFILKALEKVQWNRRETSEALGIPLSTLRFKFKKYHLKDLIPERRGTDPSPSKKRRTGPSE